MRAGRCVSRTRLADGSAVLSFLVGEDLVTTSVAVENDRVTLVVDDALAIAERCWDAGFVVRVDGVADDRPIVVIDPFGLEVEVISKRSRQPRRREQTHVALCGAPRA